MEYERRPRIAGRSLPPPHRPPHPRKGSVSIRAPFQIHKPRHHLGSASELTDNITDGIRIKAICEDSTHEKAAHESNGGSLVSTFQHPNTNHPKEK